MLLIRKAHNPLQQRQQSTATAAKATATAESSRAIRRKEEEVQTASIIALDPVQKASSAWQFAPITPPRAACTEITVAGPGGLAWQSY